MKSELHLFIIWEKGLYQKEKILEDIRKKFVILNVYKIKWSDKNFSENMSRFYGQKLPKNSHKERHVGRGNFILITLLDTSSKYEERLTSRGKEIVNINTFEAKQLYRKWTGGGHKIHTTNDILETKHDLMLLLGLEYETYYKTCTNKWTGDEIFLEQDLIGANGWENIQQLFSVLNSTINYVVLRNFECLPDKYHLEEHGDIDLLAENYNDLFYLTNAVPVFKKKYRVLNKVKINNEDILFDFRYVGDRYYDNLWEDNILKNSVLSSKGFYIPSQQYHFFSLLYHASVHKSSIKNDYIIKLISIAKELGLENISQKFFQNRSKIKNLLNNWLLKNKYKYTEPKDLSVYYNTEFIGNSSISLKRYIYNKILDIKNRIRKSKGLK